MPKALIFDWGDTLMRDFEFEGPMVSWPHVDAIPGVKQALDELCGRFVCAVGSNAGDSDGEVMAQALDRVGMRQYFRYFFTSGELGVEKPDPEFFLTILRRMNVLPQEIIMVGDNYKKDIAPAKAVGMRTIWLSEDGIAEDHPSADMIIRSMSELAAAVSRVDA